MAQDHFKTPPDPKKGNGMTTNPKNKNNLLELAKDWTRPGAIFLKKKKAPAAT